MEIGLRINLSVVFILITGLALGYLLIVLWMKSHPNNGGILSFLRPPAKMPLIDSLRVVTGLAVIQLILSLVYLPGNLGQELSVGLNAVVISVTALALHKQ